MEIGVKPDPAPGAASHGDTAKKFPKQNNKLTNYFTKAANV
jgi:hypothetical protein